MTNMHSLHKTVAWELAGHDAHRLTKISATHIRYWGVQKTLCGAEIPPTAKVLNTGGETCTRCRGRLREKKDLTRRPGAITHEEVTAAIKVFLANGGVIQKYAPTPAVPWTAFDALEV